MRLFAVIAVALALALCVAACGAGDGGRSTTGTAGSGRASLKSEVIRIDNSFNGPGSGTPPGYARFRACLHRIGLTAPAAGGRHDGIVVQLPDGAAFRKRARACLKILAEGS